MEEAVHEAGSSSRIAALVVKSGCSKCTDILQRHLLASVSDLHLGPEDRTPELCQKTFKDRQVLADILAGMKPWIVRPSTHPVRGSRPAVTSTCSGTNKATQNAATASAPKLLEFFWKPDYMDFVFMLDATHFATRTGPCTRVHRTCSSAQRMCMARLK